MPKHQNNKNPVTPAELRRLAEDRLKFHQASNPDIIVTPEEMYRMIHELQVHQFELEMQQEELARTRTALEDSLSIYTELYDFAPTGYLTLGRDSNIQKANLTATKLLGVNRSRLQGLRFKQFVFPADYRIIDDLLDTVYTTRVQGNCELRLLADPFKPSIANPVLSLRIVRLEAAISDADYTCRMSLSDITAQKVAEEELRKTERKMGSITEQIQEVIVFADDTGTITDVSPVAETMFGFLHDEIVGHSFTDYMDDDDIPAALKVLSDTVLCKTAKQVVEFKLKRKNGSLFDAEIHLQYAENEDQSAFIGLILDITERKSAERNRRHYEESLLENQQFLQSIFNDVNFSVFVVDVLADGTYRYKKNEAVNAKLTSIIHVDFSGKTPDEAFSSEAANAIKSNYDACVRAGIPIQYVEFVPFLGKDMWWDTALNPVCDASGKICRIIGTTTDITERRLAVLQAMEMSTRYDATIEASQIGTWEWNVQTGETILNNRWFEIVGYSPEELTPVSMQTWVDLTHPDDYRASMAIVEKLFNGEVPYFEYECRMKHKNGNWVWIQDRGSLISRTSDGKPLRMLGTHIDITERKLAAAESDRLKAAFLANISHEIRTPMNGIMGFSELLKDPQLTGEEQAEYLGLIQQSGDRMLALINDLMDISKIDAREAKLVESETSVNQLLRDLLAFFSLAAEQKGLRLSFTTGLPDHDSIITTDSGKLNQILTNLIQNAVKFTSKGGIDFGYSLKGTMLDFYVIDSGRGIPADQTEKIFDRFHQADISLTRAHEGSGLGLSISKAYVELLGGNITVESVEGAGSSFSFTIPYNPVHLPTTHCVKSTIPISLSKAFCILIAEDDELSTILLKKNLTGENITILCAENGWEAVELVQHHPEINLVLMDLKMPVMNGFEATKLIKQQHPDLPVIAQSAFTSQEYKEKAKEAGCDRFVTKPINKSELLDLMQELLNR